MKNENKIEIGQLAETVHHYRAHRHSPMVYIVKFENGTEIKLHRYNFKYTN